MTMITLNMKGADAVGSLRVGETAHGGTPSKRKQSSAALRLLSLKDVAAYLSISFWSVRTLIERGEIPVVRMGRRLLVDIVDLDGWISNNKELM